MVDTYLQRVSGFSMTVRSSTLRRLRSVPAGAENWAIVDGAMTFADLAHHILQCDLAFMKVFEQNTMASNAGTPGACVVTNRDEFTAILDELKETKQARHDFILEFTEAQMDTIIDVARVRGTERIPAGGLILEVLDHEIHHRGQIATYLRAYEAQAESVKA